MEKLRVANSRVSDLEADLVAADESSSSRDQSTVDRLKEARAALDDERTKHREASTTVSRLQEQLDASEIKMEDLQVALSAAKSTISDLETQAAKASEARTAAREAGIELVRAKSSLTAVTAERDQLIGSHEGLKQMEAQAHDYYATIAELTAEKESLMGRVSLVAGALSRTEDILDHTRLQLVAASGSNPLLAMFSELSAAWEKERTRRMEFEGEISSLRILSSELVTTVDSQKLLISASSSASDNSIAALSAKIANITSAVATSHRDSVEESARLQLRLTNMHTQLATTETDLAAADAHNDAIASSTNVALARLTHAEAEVDSLAAQLRFSNSHASMLETVVQTHRIAPPPTQPSPTDGVQQYAALITTVLLSALQETSHPEDQRKELVAYLLNLDPAVSLLAQVDQDYIRGRAKDAIYASHPSLTDVPFSSKAQEHAARVQSLLSCDYISRKVYERVFRGVPPTGVRNQLWW